MSSAKRPRPPEFTSLDNEVEEPTAKRRRFDEASASASKPSSALAAPVSGDDPILVSSLAPPQVNVDTPIVEIPPSGAEPVAEAQTTEKWETPKGGIRLADGEITDVSVVPESTREHSPLLPVRSPSIQLVSSSKPPKRKWHQGAFISTQKVADDDYFETPPGSPNTHDAVVDPPSVPLNQDNIQAHAASQRRERHEGVEDVGSLDLEFEEVEDEGTAVEKVKQKIDTTDYPDEVPSRNEPQAFSSPAEESGITVANVILLSDSDDEHQHPMPRHSNVPDLFSDTPVEASTRTAIKSWLTAPSKSQKDSQPVKKGLTLGHRGQGVSPAIRSTQFFKQAPEAVHSVDGYSHSPLPLSSPPHAPIFSIPTHTPTDFNASSHFNAVKSNGEGKRTNILKSSPALPGRPLKARAPPRGVPIPVRDSSPTLRSSPPQPGKVSQAERRRTFGGWPTILTTSSLRKEGANPRRERRDSTPALPTTLVYRNQQEDAVWLRSVEKKIKVIPLYADPRKRSIPSLPPESSSNDTNTADGSEDEDDLAENVSRMSSLDIERVMNVLNVAPRNRVLKQWKRQNRSDSWIIWNGLDFVLEELANRFNTGVTAAREAWAAAGDLVVTEKALYHAQETARRTITDVIQAEAMEASKRRMEIWAYSRRTSERWGSTSRKHSRLYQHGGGPPEFVPAEVIQVAVEAASSPGHDRDVRWGSSKVSREALEELPMLSFQGVGPGGVTILRE